MRVLRHFHAPNRLDLRLGGFTALKQPRPLPPLEPVSGAFLSLVEDLERVQAHARTVFPLPKALTRQDIAAIRRAGRLVAGERVQVGRGTANAVMTLKDPKAFEQQVVDDTPFAITFGDDNYTETVADIEVPLGPATASIASATIANRAELLATRPWHPDQELSVDFQPSPGVQTEILLVRSGKTDSG